MNKNKCELIAGYAYSFFVIISGLFLSIRKRITNNRQIITDTTMTTDSHLSVTAYDYDLPEQLIARYPLPVRSASRLMYISNADTDATTPNTTTRTYIEDRQFTELPDLLNKGDLLIFNDTKVMKARLFGQKDTGGKVEVLVERLTDESKFTQDTDGVTHSNVALCHVRASKAPKQGQRLQLADNAIGCMVIGRHENLFILAFDEPILSNLEKYGELPIPPYFERHADETDNQRYQTVFHDPSKLASVASPTASLHFDDEILARLADKGVQSAFVTLHVGAGTFAPVKTDNILEHTMHSEYADLPQATADLINQTHASGGQVIAVGTTVTRVLETAYQKTGQKTEQKTGQNGKVSAWAGDTNIFIYPGFKFQVIDRLLTNFHLPKSTLLMLVSAFAGKDRVMKAYQHAVAEQYRFFSYGDSMLLDKMSG